MKQSDRVTTPVVLQLEMTECGAAALGIILEYYGRIVPLTELREECGVSRDGSKASSMLKAARRYGLKCKGFKETVESARELARPYIVFWNFNHFVVVEGFDRKEKTVYLNDPAHGHRKVTFDEFDDSFTGVVLLFEPSEDFRKGGQKPSVLDAVRKRLVNARAALLYLLLAGLVLTVPGLIIPAYTRVYLDHVIGELRMDWLKPLVAVIVVTVIFKLSVEIAKYACLRRLRIFLSASMSREFFQHLLNLPLKFYSQRYSGEIASRQGLNDNLAEILSVKLANTAISVLMVVFYALLMLSYSVRLTLIGILFVGTSFYLLKVLGKRRTEANMRMRQDFGRVAGESIAALQSMETIKVSGQESAFFTKWGGRYARAINSMQDLQTVAQSLAMLPLLFKSLNTMFIYLIGGLAVIDGHMSVGTLIAFTALMANFQEPVKNLVDLGGDIQQLEGDLKRLDDVLAAKVDSPDGELRDTGKKEWPLKLSGQVSMKDVTFGYSPIEEPLFSGIDIDIPAGKWVALVGASGSGKTTVANLICGLYRPSKGEITFDGFTREDIPRSLMTNSFSYVGQDIFLFEGSVRDNLTLWDRSVPGETLLKACEDGAILDVVQALPGALDGLLIEGGANLSGGQRQRLEIARALVNNPAVLVLDEATSALDAETEQFIIERLRWRGCTCILVAHRLSTIRDCDEIIVLDGGKIVERGSHDDLWKLQGSYADLLRAGEGVEEEG